MSTSLFGRPTWFPALFLFGMIQTASRHYDTALVLGRRLHFCVFVCKCSSASLWLPMHILQRSEPNIDIAYGSNRECFFAVFHVENRSNVFPSVHTVCWVVCLSGRSSVEWLAPLNTHFSTKYVSSIKTWTFCNTFVLFFLAVRT